MLVRRRKIIPDGVELKQFVDEFIRNVNESFELSYMFLLLSFFTFVIIFRFVIKQKF